MKSYGFSYVDTCFSDYLTDHHNRPGEALVCAGLGGTSEDAFEELKREFEVSDDIPEGAFATLAAEIWEDCKRLDWRATNPVTGDRVDDPKTLSEREQPSVWFLVTWDEDGLSEDEDEDQYAMSGWQEGDRVETGNGPPFDLNTGTVALVEGDRVLVNWDPPSSTGPFLTSWVASGELRPWPKPREAL